MLNKKSQSKILPIIFIFIFLVIAITSYFVFAAQGDYVTEWTPDGGSSGSKWDITDDGTYLYISDDATNELYKYYMNGTYTGSFIDVDIEINDASGVAYYSGYFYVFDYNTDDVFKYYSNGTYTGTHFDCAGDGHADSGGMATDGTYLYLADEIDDDVYRYQMDGTFVDVLLHDVGLQGIAYYNNYLWIFDTADDEVYKYYTNGTAEGSHFDTNSDGCTNGLGIHTNGEYIWIYDWYQDKVYVYEGPGIAGDSTPPSVTLNEPTDYKNYSSPITDLFNCTVFDYVNLSNVTFYWNVSGSWIANGTNSSGINNSKYQFSRDINQEGTFLWNCYACDNSSNCAWGSSNRTFTYKKDPNITINSPQNITYNTTSILFNITATSSDYSIDTCQYSVDSAENLSLNQEVLILEGNYTGNSFDTSGSGNGVPVGITQNGTFFWITDSSDDEVYKYYMNGTYTQEHFDIAADGILAPQGITQNGTFFWINDLYTQEVYKYYMNGTYTGNSFDTSGSGNGNPVGLTQNGTFFWISDNSDKKIYKYYMNGTYTGNSFDTSGSGNNAPLGCTQDNNFIWVTNAANYKVYKYYMNGTYTGNSFNVLEIENQNLYAITQNGTFFWISDTITDEVYKYYLEKIYSNNWINTSTASHGSHTVIFYCNNTNGNWNNEQISFSVNTCEYSSGNWEIDCSAYCNITSNTDLGGNNISIIGDGVFTTTANITGFNKVHISGGAGHCTARCLNGGCFKE